MSLVLFLSVIFVALLVAFFAKSPDPPFATPMSTSNLVQLINAERVKNGLNILAENSRLNEAALQFAIEMNTFQFQNHVSPTGKGPTDRVRNAGVPFSGVGENLAWGPLTDREAVEAWMASPAHLRNILDPRWKQTGIGIITGRVSQWGNFPVKYYVQNFVF